MQKRIFSEIIIMQKPAAFPVYTAGKSDSRPVPSILFSCFAIVG